MRMRSIALTTTLALATACATELTPDDNGDDGPVMVDEVGGPNVGHTDEGEGVVSTMVDATSEDEWIYLDLESGEQLDVGDPWDDLDWELGFQRFNIKLNGGESGTAEVDAAMLEDVAFEDVLTAPADGYTSDQPDGDDEDEFPEYVLSEWYDYDVMTHLLSPREIVWVIRTAEPRYYKLRVEAYYDDAGTSGHMTFRWARIEGP